MASFTKRLNALEAAAKALMVEQRRHDPFVMFEPWNIIKDQYNVYYRPEGMYKSAVKYGDLSYAEACTLLASYPGDLHCQISMGSCLEWLFAFHYFTDHSKLYTREQLDRFQKKDLEDNPELTYLLNTAEGKRIVESFSKLPQSYVVRLSTLQQALAE